MEEVQPAGVVMKPYEESLAGLTEHTNALRLATIDEEDWALVANHLRTIEVDLGKKRREIEADATAIAQETRKTEPYGKKVEYESDRGSLVEQKSRAYSSPGSAPGRQPAPLQSRSARRATSPST